MKIYCNKVQLTILHFVAESLKNKVLNNTMIKKIHLILVKDSYRSNLYLDRLPRNKFRFLTVSMDGAFRKWVSSKPECTETFQSNEEVSFSKIINGNVLLTIGESVKLWEINSFKLVKSLPKFADFVKSYKLNGNRIFVSFENGLLECWNLDSKKCVFSILAHTDVITSIKLVRNKYILTSGKDAKIFLWKYDTGEQIRLFEAHKDKVFRLKIISDTIFASCSADKTICIWNIDNNKCIKMLVGHQSKILNMKFGNNILVSASLDCTIRYWDGSNGHTQGIAYLKLFLEENRMVSTSIGRKFEGHEDFILAAKMVYRDFLLSASHDGT
ncbi:Fis family transcriptional regulator, partial [Brachionus plicatilis]